MLKRLQIYLRILRFNSTITKNSHNIIPEDSSQQWTLEQSQIDNIVKSVPSLVNVSTDIWQKAHSIFTEYGFKTKSFTQIVAEHPKVLTRPTAKISDSLEFWRGCQFGENRVENLILRYPELLEISNNRKILSQIHALKSLVHTSKNVWTLLMNSPNLIHENIKTIEAKFNYMHDIMRLEIPEIVKSQAFSYTLDDIKTRHVFLERLGIFKPRSPKAPPGEISKNPRLHQIMDSTESQFATKVGLVTLAEFEAFKELFKRELNRERNKRSDESDEDE
ncbi:unnamed protein product [Hermetia illucens]|uniref:Uncharacterized protein n=1 Tax=Hermetia illucens TaxID=343691 RepID=A0A7R8UDS1_HERIL|nr:transcription termination factor 4, mitochondrial [Hermetia illucens]CAD7078913.1 unnamed protein product [Hermetia illucens]